MCPNRGPFDSDANKIKLKAREMIKMTRAINDANFDGHQVVTCNTCHRGNPLPKGVPDPWYKTSEQIAALNPSLQAAGSIEATVNRPPEAVTALPDAEQVMAAYRTAVGAKSLKSIHVTGTNSVAAGGVTSFEAYLAFPDKYSITTTSRGIEITEILNGEKGWRLTPKSRTELVSGNLSSARARFESILSPVKFERSAGPQGRRDRKDRQ